MCAEMVSASALEHGSAKSGRMLEVAAREHPVSLQIFGSTPESISLAAKRAEAAGADIIDINAGCPVKKINRAGAGCVLIKDEAKLASLVSAAVNSVRVPVTLKTRIGLTKSSFKGADLVRLAENEGASAVTIHARWASDMHAGPIHLDYLAECAAAAKKIPVIGNGGVESRAGAQEILKTGCKAVMIGRGAVGNPYIFKNIIEDNRALMDARERVKIFLDLVKENVAFYGEHTGVMRSRKTVGFWLNGFPGAANARVKFLALSEQKEIEKFLRSLT